MSMTKFRGTKPALPLLTVTKSDGADRTGFQKLLTIALEIRKARVNGKLDWDALR